MSAPQKTGICDPLAETRRRRRKRIDSDAVSIFDRFFGAPKGGGRVEVPVQPVVAAMSRAATALEAVDVDAALVGARLGDHCRDASVEPIDPALFESSARPLDAQGWRRLAVLTAALDQPELRAGVASSLQAKGAAEVVGAIVASAKEKRLLEMGVLCRSPLRVEELARDLLARVDAPVAGETREQSRAALERLDYERLLALAEQAREAARQRMEYLKKAQDADDKARGPRRGKW